MKFFIKQLGLLSFLALSFSCFAQTNIVSISNKTVLLDEEICLDIHLLNFDESGIGEYEVSWSADISTLVNATSDNKKLFSKLAEDKRSNSGVLHFTITNEMLENIKYGSLKPSICLLPHTEGATDIIVKKLESPKNKIVSKGQLSVSRSSAAGERLIASMEVANAGTEACVEISVEGFTTINRLTFGINAPINVGVFNEARNFNLNGLTAADVMDIPVFGTTVEWDAPNQNTGVTVPDGTVIVELCYDITGTPGTTAPIVFNVPTVFNLFFGIDGSQTPPDIEEGSITIPDVAPLEIQDEFISSDNCIDVDNGEILITPNGGVPPYTFIWSNTTTDENLIGVPGGSYTVTISDSNVPMNQLTASFTVPTDTISPIADAGPVQSITCDDNIVTLGSNNTSSGPEFEYQWLGPPGVMFVSGINDIMAEVDTPGEYNFRVIDTENGCDSEATVLVEDATANPNLTVPADQALTCQDGGLILEAMNDENLSNISAVWTVVSDGVIDSVVDDLSISISTPGVYEVVLTNDDTGCTSMASVTISPPVLPVISLVGMPDDLNCDQNTVMLTATFDPASTILWTTSNGIIDSGENTASITVSSAGTYQAEVTDGVTNCTNTIDVEVLGDTSEPSVMAGEDLTINCDIPTVTLMGNTDTPDGSIAWTDADGNFAGNELTLEVNRPGLYNLNITNDFGCMRTDQLEVFADTMSPISNAGLDMEVACIGADINLDGSGSSIGPEFTYMWSTVNGILVSGFTTLTPAISSAGVYDLVVTNTDNGCTAISNVEISIQGDLPTADGGEDFSSCENQVSLTGNLDPGILGVWTTTSNANIDNPNSASISVTNLSPGANEFRWTLSTADCADFSSDVVTVILESTPNATDDIFTIPLDSSIISSNVILNDNLTSDDITIEFTPADPNFTDIGDGSFSYTFPNDSILTITFNYLICSAVCPTLCDSAIINLVREEPPIEPVDLDDLPNAITPNGDGLNDALVFDIMLTRPQDFPNPELVVFNRWGDVVFRQQPYDNNWQGTNQSGDALPEGTYYFINRLSLEETEILSGDVTIIRD